MKVEDKVREVLVETSCMEPSDIELSSDLKEDLDLDSLEVIELTMALEEEYDLEISDEEMEKLKTVKDVIDYIEKRIKK